MNDHLEIATERLVLRPLAPAHAEQLYAIYSDPGAMRFWATPQHRDLKDTVTMINAFLTGSERAWTLFLRAEGQAIGLVYYVGNPGAPGMGYIIHALHRGLGLMSEAVQAALKYGYEKLRFDRVELWIDSRNSASWRLAERNGFKQRAAFRGKYPHEALSHETLVYGLRVDEWRSRGAERSVQAPKAYSAVPVISVPDVRRAAEYYRDFLGFEIEFLFGAPPTYGAVSLLTWTATGAQIRFARTDSELSTNSVSLYLNVGPEIDVLYETYRRSGVTIKSAPAQMPWGMKEFRVADCNGYVLCFGTPA